MVGVTGTKLRPRWSSCNKADWDATCWWAKAAVNLLVPVKSTSNGSQKGIYNGIYDGVLTISVLVEA